MKGVLSIYPNVLLFIRSITGILNATIVKIRFA